MRMQVIRGEHGDASPCVGHKASTVYSLMGNINRQQ